MNRAELLEGALAAVNARPKAYGPPERNFDRIARFWSVYAHDAMGAPPDMRTFTATDVACMMALMKIARLEETPDHVDSWVDLAGYAACGAEVSTGVTIEHSADDAPKFKVGDRVKAYGLAGVVVALDSEDPNRPFGIRFDSDPPSFRTWPPLGEIVAA